MNASPRNLARVLQSLSPAAGVIIGIGFILAVGVLDLAAPRRVSGVVFYLMAIVFVGWHSGKVASIFAAVVATGILACKDWFFNPAGPPTTAVLAWNISSSILAFSGAGWLAAHAAGVATRLRRLIQKRTARWEQEAKEHKTASAHLAETLERIKQVTDNITEVFWLTDVRTQEMVFISPGYEKVWGRKCEDLYRRPRVWLDYVHPEDRGRVESQLLEQASGNYNTEYRIVRPDGAVRWIHDRAFRVADASGKVYRVVGIARDITDRKQTESALREAEARYRSLAETSPDAILIMDREFVIQYINSGGAEMYGRTPGAVIGKNQRELFPADYARRNEENIKEVFGTGTVLVREDPVTVAAGDRWLETRLVPMRDEHGNVVAVLVSSRDITERKRSEFLLQAERDVGTSLSLTSDLNSALVQLLEIAVQLEGVDCGGIYLLDAETGHLKLAAHRNLSPAFLEQVADVPPESVEFRLIMEQKPIHALHAELGTEKLREGLRAIAVVPLLHEEEVLGCINVASHVHEQIPASTRGVIEAIAKQASGAIARLRAEEALQQSEARLRAIITGAPLIVFTGDRQGILTFLEGQALKTLGTAPEASIGRNLAEVFGDDSAVLEHVERVVAGEEFSTTIEIGPLVFECWFSPTRDREGQVSGFIGVATNVTERQRLQRQILEISDREQARIGQDIHDGLCQQLVSLAFDANALEDRLAADGHPAMTTVARIAALLDDAITQSRQLSRGLFPIRLDAEGLPSALEELAENTEDRFGIRCELHCAEPVLVKDHATATNLYRIAQEAINNAIKHGRARRIDVYLRSDPEHVELKIDDDGLGFKAENWYPTEGMGLHIMHYRARTMGGNLKVSSRSGGGTTIACEVRSVAEAH